MSYTSSGVFAVIFAALLWSLDGFLRQSLYTVSPTVVVFWEHLFGFAVLLPFILLTLKKFRQLSKKQWYSIALVSFLSGALGTILYTGALGHVQYIPFSVVVLLQQLQPLFAITAAAVLLKEPMGKRFLEWAIVAVIAAYMVSFPTLRVAITPQNGTLIAAAMAVGAAASWGVSTAFSKYSLRHVSFMHVTAIRFGFTPLFALAMVFLFNQSQALFSLDSVQWKYIALITCSTGLVALAIYYFGLQRVPASRSTILELTWPLSAALVGYVFLGDRLTITQWIGAALLVISMYVISKDSARVKEQMFSLEATEEPA